MITVRFEKTASDEKFIRTATFPDGRTFTGELQLSPDLYLPGAPYQWNIPEHQLPENFLKATGGRLALAALGEDGTAEFVQRKRAEDLYSVPPVLAFYLTASGVKHGMGQAIYNKYSHTIASVYYAIYREGEKTWHKELACGKGAGRGREYLDYLVKRHSASRQWKETLENYEKAIQWNEKTSQFHKIGGTYHQIGRVYEEQRQWKDASDAYLVSLRGYIKYAPESPDVAVVIGSIKRLYDRMVGADVDISEELKEIIEKKIR